MPTKDTIIRIDIPADHHPGMLKGDSLGTGIGREALAHIYDAYGKINDVARAVEDKGRLATRVQPFAETAIAKADTLLGKLRALDTHLRKAVNEALSPVQVPNERSDIRSFWRSRKSPFTELVPLVDAGDMATIGAVLSGPAYLSGLTAEQQGVLRERAEQVIRPDETAHLKEVRAATSRVERALSHFVDTMAGNLRSWRDDDQKHLEQLA